MFRISWIDRIEPAFSKGRSVPVERTRTFDTKAERRAFYGRLLRDGIDACAVSFPDELNHAERMRYRAFGRAA